MHSPPSPPLPLPPKSVIRWGIELLERRVSETNRCPSTGGYVEHNRYNSRARNLSAPAHLSCRLTSQPPRPSLSSRPTSVRNPPRIHIYAHIVQCTAGVKRHPSSATLGSRAGAGATPLTTVSTTCRQPTMMTKILGGFTTWRVLGGGWARGGLRVGKTASDLSPISRCKSRRSAGHRRLRDTTMTCGSETCPTEEESGSTNCLFFFFLDVLVGHFECAFFL